MFRVEYAILSNEKKRLKQVEKITFFEEDLDEIEGQIYIACNENEIGFVDESIPYEGEFLVTWLWRLNSGILHLDNNGYFAMLIPDSADVWLEFELMNKVVRVSKIKTVKRYKDTTMTKPIESTKIFWSENIVKIELIQEILKKTEAFIQEVYSINKLLVESTEIKRLINTFQMAKDDVCINYLEE